MYRDDYPETPDEIVLDWYAGSIYLNPFQPASAPIDDALWQGADVALAFSDLGLTDGGNRGQIVLYAVDRAGDSTSAISLEIDHDDAHRLIQHLLDFMRASEEV